jgi:hypothetical protein
VLLLLVVQRQVLAVIQLLAVTASTCQLQPVPASYWQLLAVPGSTCQLLAVTGSTCQLLAVTDSIWAALAGAWAALVAIYAGYHGWPENAANCVAEGGVNGYVEVYVGIVQNSK